MENKIFFKIHAKYLWLKSHWYGVNIKKILNQVKQQKCDCNLMCLQTFGILRIKTCVCHHQGKQIWSKKEFKNVVNAQNESLVHYLWLDEIARGKVHLQFLNKTGAQIRQSQLAIHFPHEGVTFGLKFYI